MKPITLMIVGNTHKNMMDFAISKTIQHCSQIEDVVIFDEKKLRPNFDIHDYTYFSLKNMWAFVKTDFVLIIQYDGMAANRTKWTDEFLQYDYIGAPWPDRFTWIGKDEKVGNGGFSLRSAKLLDALRDPLIHPRQDPRFANEDAAICQGYSKYLRDKKGIKFAPVELANQFSHEWCNPTGETFGFHGVWNFPLFFTEQECLEYLLDIPVGHWYNDRIEMLRQNCQKKDYAKLWQEIAQKVTNA